MDTSAPSTTSSEPPLQNKWTREEDERLLEGLDIYGEGNWNLIAEYAVKTRDAMKCEQRWEKVLRPGLIKGRWTREQDIKLAELVEKYGNCWLKVSQNMNGRTSKQCRERWLNYVNPAVSRDSFTPEEDVTLRELYSKYGNRWSLIAKELVGRTETSVRLRVKALTGIDKQRQQSGFYRPKVVYDMVKINEDGVTKVKAVPKMVNKSTTPLYYNAEDTITKIHAGATYDISSNIISGSSIAKSIAPQEPLTVAIVSTETSENEPSMEEPEVVVDMTEDIRLALAANNSECVPEEEEVIVGGDNSNLNRQAENEVPVILPVSERPATSLSKAVKQPVSSVNPDDNSQRTKRRISQFYNPITNMYELANPFANSSSSASYGTSYPSITSSSQPSINFNPQSLSNQPPVLGHTQYFNKQFKTTKNKKAKNVFLGPLPNNLDRNNAYSNQYMPAYNPNVLYPPMNSYVSNVIPNYQYSAPVALPVANSAVAIPSTTAIVAPVAVPTPTPIRAAAPVATPYDDATTIRQICGPIDASTGEPGIEDTEPFSADLEVIFTNLFPSKK